MRFIWFSDGGSNGNTRRPRPPPGGLIHRYRFRSPVVERVLSVLARGSRRRRKLAASGASRLTGHLHELPHRGSIARESRFPIGKPVLLYALLDLAYPLSRLCPLSCSKPTAASDSRGIPIWYLCTRAELLLRMDMHICTLKRIYYYYWISCACVCTIIKVRAWYRLWRVRCSGFLAF